MAIMQESVSLNSMSPMTAIGLAIIAHVLGQLASDTKLDLRRADLRIIGDNSTKEAKNNSLLRLCSGLVMRSKVRSASLYFLESRHSHEDWDQWFS